MVLDWNNLALDKTKILWYNKDTKLSGRKEIDNDMKLIVLLDCDDDAFRLILNQVKKLDVRWAKCDDYNGDRELDYIVNAINNFFKGYGKLLLIKYSGNENISKILGDEIPLMIISLSSNENNHYYVSDLPRIFKETIINLLYKEK